MTKHPELQELSLKIAKSLSSEEENNKTFSKIRLGKALQKTVAVLEELGLGDFKTRCYLQDLRDQSALCDPAGDAYKILRNVMTSVAEAMNGKYPDA